MDVKYNIFSGLSRETNAIRSGSGLAHSEGDSHRIQGVVAMARKGSEDSVETGGKETKNSKQQRDLAKLRRGERMINFMLVLIIFLVIGCC